MRGRLGALVLVVLLALLPSSDARATGCVPHFEMLLAGEGVTPGSRYIVRYAIDPDPPVDGWYYAENGVRPGLQRGADHVVLGPAWGHDHVCQGPVPTERGFLLS